MWASGGALSFTLLLAGGLLLVVLYNGLGVFWPSTVSLLTLEDGTRVLGERVQHEVNPETGQPRAKYKTGNREDGPAFRWVDDARIVQTEVPPEAVVLERMTNLNYYGFFKEFDTPGLEPPVEGGAQQRLAAACAAARQRHENEVEPIAAEVAALAEGLKSLKYEAIRQNYRKKQLLRGGAAPDSEEVASLDGSIAEIEARQHEIKAESDRVAARQAKREAELRRNVAVFTDAGGRDKRIALLDIVRGYCPNQMGVGQKAGHYAVKLWEVVATDPREANQDGGLFPAIFGTVLLVFLMAITCFPLGVLAGIYLGEYAKDGPLVRLVRVAVNNLAGIPSIVYGIFGLGFFIYIVGGNLDRLFYPELLDPQVGERVFGQPCILWASLTLGLLTIPVVIVATEEAVRTIPRGVREGSYALGATKFQTLVRVLFPMASPGMMTGFILAMARAAGEVAPLMITGALKSAPVPVDGNLPFVHLDRQFMHLGFHIYDISCKSPNVEATKPMVYVTTLLLLLIVLSMSSLAIWLRNRMRKRYLVRTL